MLLEKLEKQSNVAAQVWVALNKTELQERRMQEVIRQLRLAAGHSIRCSLNGAQPCTIGPHG